MKLTGTNRSIGLIPPIINARKSADLRALDYQDVLSNFDLCVCDLMPKTRGEEARKRRPGRKNEISVKTVLRWSGGYGEGPKPVPIPNTAVKPLSADGTLS